MKYYKTLILFMFVLFISFFTSVNVLSYSPTLDIFGPSGFGLIPLEENDIGIEKIDINFDGKGNWIESESLYEVMVTNKYKMRNPGETKKVKIGLPFFSDNIIGERVNLINFSINNKIIEPKILFGNSIHTMDTDRLTYESITEDLISEDLFSDTMAAGKYYVISADQNDVTVDLEFSLDNKVFYEGFSSKVKDKSVVDRHKIKLTKANGEPASVYDPYGNAIITINNGRISESSLSFIDFAINIIGDSFNKSVLIEMELKFLELENDLIDYESLYDKSNETSNSRSNRLMVLEYDVELLGNNEPNDISVNFLLVPTIKLSYNPNIYHYNFIHFHKLWDPYDLKTLYDVDISINPDSEIKNMNKPLFDFASIDKESYKLSVREIGYNNFEFELCSVQNPVHIKAPLIYTRTQIIILSFIVVFIVLFVIFLVYIILKIFKRKRFLDY